MADPSPSPPPASPETPPVCARQTQRAAVLLLVVLSALLGFRWWHDYSGPRPTDLSPGASANHKVELNRASRSELMQLPGVGASRADKILAYRSSVGGFRHIEDFRNVDGIGPITFERLKPYVQVDEPFDDDEQPLRLSRKNEPVVASKANPAKQPGQLDLNRASVAELEALPGIGPVLAQRIAAERDRKPFEKIDDLRRVSGIGVKRLEQIKPFVVVGP